MIPSSRLAGAWDADIPDVTPEGGDHLLCVVSRAVVNHNALNHRVGLRKDAANRLGDMVRTVVNRNDGGDFRRAPAVDPVPAALNVSFVRGAYPLTPRFRSRLPSNTSASTRGIADQTPNRGYGERRQ